MRVKEESEKAGLKVNIQKTKIIASGLITLQPIDDGKVETVTDFIPMGSKITADSDCNHEIKRRFDTNYISKKISNAIFASILLSIIKSICVPSLIDN